MLGHHQEVSIRPGHPGDYLTKASYRPRPPIGYLTKQATARLYFNSKLVMCSDKLASYA